MATTIESSFDCVTFSSGSKAQKAQDVFRATSSLQVFCLRAQGLVPVCSLASFRDIYGYLVSAMVLLSITQQTPRAAKQTLRAHTLIDDWVGSPYRADLQSSDIERCVAAPGCVGAHALGLDLLSGQGCPEFFSLGTRGFLSSAVQRLGELVYRTTDFPLSSLSPKAREAFANAANTAIYQVTQQFALPPHEQESTTTVLDAIQASGHFVVMA